MVEINKELTYAIVGASKNQEKYGNIVLNDLKSAGMKLVPINPKEEEIEGFKVYPKLADIPDKPDVVVFIVPPAVTETVLNEVKELEIKSVWMQPGSYSDAAVKFCADNGIDCESNECIMVARKRLGIE